MISRFNLDQKRLNFYEDNKKFNEEFNLLHKDTNSEQKSYEIEKPSVLINGENTLKICLIKNDKEFKYILFSHHSISMLSNEKLSIEKTLKEPSTFQIFTLNV